MTLSRFINLSRTSLARFLMICLGVTVISSCSTQTPIKDEPKDVIVAKVSHNALDSLLNEFEQYHSETSPDKKPEIKVTRYSQNKERLLIEFAITQPNQGETNHFNVVFTKDAEGRFVTKDKILPFLGLSNS